MKKILSSAFLFVTLAFASLAVAQTMGGGGGGGGSAPCSSFGTTTGTCLQGAGALGTPSSGTGTNITGLPISTGVSGLGTGVGTLLGGTSSGTGGPAGTASPTFTGSPIVPTQAASDNSTKAASTAYVTTGIANAIAAQNPAVAVQAATTTAADTSSYTYSNGVGGIGATLTGVVNTALTVDGFTFTAVGQRLLVKNDTQSPSGAFNGIYNVTQIQTGILPVILTRALDYDQPSDINNTGAIPVINGTINGTTQWVITSTVNTVGTDPATFAKFSSNPATVLSNTLTNTHVFVGNSSNVATDVAMSGDVTMANTGAATVRANIRVRDFGTTFGDTTGSALTSGPVVYFTVPYACTISAYNITADAGTVTFDVWKIATGTAIPTVTNTITAAALPALSTGTALHSTTLSGWTTSVSANDIFGIQLKTVATAKYVQLDLECDQ